MLEAVVGWIVTFVKGSLLTFENNISRIQMAVLLEGLIHMFYGNVRKFLL